MIRIFVAACLVALWAWPMMAEAAKKKTRCRDAETGRYVSDQYASSHPTTTVCERIEHK